MRKIGFFVVLFCISIVSYAGWINLNTGINDNLTGVVFWGNNGLVSGSKGLYYTTTGGSGSSAWNRFNITTNHNDSLLYNRTKFSHAYSAQNSTYGMNKAVVCGLDTINNSSVIMLINLSVLSYTLVYNGPVNSGGFNKATFNYQDYNYYAVGNNGQFAKFDYNGNSFVQISTPLASDYTSVSFSSNNFCLVSNGNIVNGTRNGSTYTFTATTSPATHSYKDVSCMGLNNCYFAGNGYFKWYTLNFSQIPNYDFGSLNASCLFYYNNSHYVGTDHGIFKSSSSYNFLEWQPSSLNYKIKNLWSSGGSGTTIYACGLNGVVLSTTDEGGATKPYAGLNLPGGCVGVPLTMSGIVGSSNNCEWYIDNSLDFSMCNTSFQSSFAIGQHTIELIVTNSFGLKDTARQIINVVDYPKINKPVSLNKTILCKQEPLVITIDSSQQNVYYTLAQFGSSNLFGNSGNGNNSSITYTSYPVSASGNYYIKANSTLAQCSKNFTDTLKITVEKTHSNFHTATLNSEPGEPVANYQNCIDAQNYLWTFTGGGPNTTSSSVANPTVSYSSVAPTTIKLICWSNNGCYDSLQKAGPNLYVAPVADDSCWTLVNNAPDPSWQGHYDFDIAQLSPSKTGFFACGTYFRESFASRYGDSLRMNPKGGAYVGKYDFKGALKWMNYSVQSDYNAYPGYATRDVITSVKEDSKGNVYICGRVHSYFYDNKGDSLLIQDQHSSNFSNIYFMAKLDSTGKFLWRLCGYGFLPKKITIDKSDNILLYSEMGSANIIIERNGVPTYTIASATNPFFLKIDPAGTVLWYCKSSALVYDIGVDAANNIYVMGGFQNGMTFYSAGSSTSSASFTANPNNQGWQIFLAKYDSLGQFTWKFRALMNGNASAFANSMAVDNDGNMYLTGSIDAQSAVYRMLTIYNTDGTKDSTNQGQYYTMKISKDGIFKWFNSTQNVSIAKGNVINLYGNEVSSIGLYGNYALPPTSTFNSQNGTGATVTMGTNDYFMTIYDTLGNLKKVIRNGANPHSPTYVARYLMYMFRANSGDYYTGECMSLLSSLSYTNFNTYIAPTNGYDGVISKFSGLNCALVTYPNTVTQLSGPLKEPSLSIYPNPAGNLLYIKDVNGSENLSVKLISIVGQEIYAKYDNGIVNLENVAPGMYFLEVYRDNKLYHQEKIIKE